MLPLHESFRVERVSIAPFSPGQLGAAIGIPSRLRDAGVREEDLRRIAEKAFLDASHRGNPRPCSEEELFAMAREAF